MRSWPALVTVAVAWLGGCDSHLEAKVGGATLAQALGVIPAPAAPVVVLRRDHPPITLPPGPVRVAIDLHTPWSQVHPLLDEGVAAGSQPILLVGQRNRIWGFVLEDAPGHDPAIRLDPTAAGKFCLSPPDNQDRYCVESGDHLHISAMYVRDAVKKAVTEWGLTRVRVRPSQDVNWGDLVRTIDGARTCCKVPVQVTVAR